VTKLEISIFNFNFRLFSFLEMD